ncbi:ead/Ea22-like family protein [Klebsiella pasteurii]|uniref:ead/Ea22-like family protein n=1 Tax=Klebsiella pasteurii TaxID=2587529 RepID=UPI0032E5DDF4
MTDITELAQSLKAEAENAIGAHERLAAYPYGEIIDISQHEGEQIDIDITDLNEFNKEANPVNILALVGALEKAQRANAAQDDHINQQQDRIESLEKKNAELGKYAGKLESRTVKLPPKIERDDTDGWFMYNGGRVGGGAAEWYNKALDDVGAELTAAGIKGEAE